MRGVKITQNKLDFEEYGHIPSTYFVMRVNSWKSNRNHYEISLKNSVGQVSLPRRFSIVSIPHFMYRFHGCRTVLWPSPQKSIKSALAQDNKQKNKQPTVLMLPRSNYNNLDGLEGLWRATQRNARFVCLFYSFVFAAASMATIEKFRKSRVARCINWVKRGGAVDINFCLF